MLRHIYQDIQGWFDFERVYDLSVSTQIGEFVEVGAWLGKSTAYLAVQIANSGKPIHLNVVDTWLGSPGEESEALARTMPTYQLFENNMRSAGVFDSMRIFKMTSRQAVSHFQDQSVAFVFIDAAHNYEDCHADITAWLPKVKPGGLIGGHDFSRHYPGVVRAVLEIFNGADFEIIGSSWCRKI